MFHTVAPLNLKGGHSNCHVAYACAVKTVQSFLSSSETSSALELELGYNYASFTIIIMMMMRRRVVVMMMMMMMMTSCEASVRKSCFGIGSIATCP